MVQLTLFIEPGGYLQWDEADLGGLHRLSPNPSTSHVRTDQLYAKVEERFNPKNLSLE